MKNNIKKFGKFSLPAGKMSFGLWFVVAVGLGIIGGSLTFAGQTFESGGLLVGGYVVGTIGGAVVAWGVWTFLVKTIRLIVPLFAVERVEIDLAQETQAISEAEENEADKALSGLSNTLALIETDVQNADGLIVDANYFVGIIIPIIQALIMRSGQMREETEVINRAMLAMENENAKGLARIKGQIRDPHLSQLIISTIPLSHDYWIGVISSFSVHAGTLERWSMDFERTSERLLTEITRQKKTAFDLASRVELSAVSMPLLRVESSLSLASAMLKLPQGGKAKASRLTATTNALRLDGGR